MADYSNPPASPYHPPHHQQRYYGHQHQQHQHYHHQASSAAVPTTSNERHNHAGGEASGATAGLQRNDPSPYSNVYGDDAGNGTTALDSTEQQSQSTSGTRYFELRTPALARDSTGSTTTGGPATSATSSSSSYASAAATPTQQYAQPQQAYDTQQYPHQDGHQEQQQQLVKLEVTSSFNDPQSEQQPSYGMGHPNTSSALGHHQQQQQHQRHQNPQYLLPPPPSFRQPTLPLLPAHPDGTIPHYTFGASPLNESDHAAPKAEVHVINRFSE
ncbi:hypothetical protein FRC00_010997 [Tulasnella sp. 408]|nr:hypothetical protein FRC00_010997 [Tulasnella sp. 408]